MKCFSVILLIVFLPIATFAARAADDPIGFSVVERALSTGKSVTVAVDLSLCTPATGDARPSKTRGGIRINAYRLTDDGALAFADEHLTVDLDGKPIIQLLRYKVHADSSAEFTMTVFSLPEYAQKGKILAFKCAINQGLSFFTTH